MFAPHCIAGTDETKVVDELQPYTEHATLIPKTKFALAHLKDVLGAEIVE